MTLDERRYFIASDVALLLKREYGMTDDLLRVGNVTVDDSLPAGHAYVIKPPEMYGPPRPPIKWLAFEGPVLRNWSAVTVTTIC